jgi:hypothetical protein
MKPQSESISRNKIVQEIVDGLERNLSFLKDLKQFQKLSQQQVNRYRDFLNKGSTDMPVEDTRYLVKMTGSPEKASSIQDVVAFFVKLQEQNERIFSGVLMGLERDNIINNVVSLRIKNLVEGIKPFLERTEKKRLREQYKSKIARSFKGIKTGCKLKVQFKKGFSDSFESYDAERDIADIIPVADVSIEVENSKDKEPLEFQVDVFEIDQIVETLRNTRKQLEAISKKVKLSKK